jgi:hypothetical protein
VKVIGSDLFGSEGGRVVVMADDSGKCGDTPFLTKTTEWE